MEFVNCERAYEEHRQKPFNTTLGGVSNFLLPGCLLLIPEPFSNVILPLHSDFFRRGTNFICWETEYKMSIP